ncbi:pyridoxal 5'-phosphate synthase glutaminase subunit PdxT [Nonomuraea sp. MG754425]|uniref:pyridoxal 5'-phosphate synthase glutaminase subunit PdxT n=1 Tax=Nonomuraea sp. MG754425 TaxID=2570319 RepID=UPI001F024400|nr:pyridoxal 5'-phosphate synthase glutaminase subunit PdxT [Nonomuraea sp. MG754425]MCF6471183.1 pyridoxal 5'-phosphate synthase glutaminase subunit PdxT [Nonomuraea sp. MG754425]
MPAIGVLALQGDVREHVRMLREAGATAAAVRRPAELDAVDALVIPGGESTTMWKLAETFDMLEPLRLRVKEGMPAYGSCAGMIMLADRIEDGTAGQQTVGGIDMVVRRNAFGRQVHSFESDLDFAGERVHAIFIRAPWVESVGADVEVLGRCEPGDRIVAVRQGPLLATSFHPELTGDVSVHRYFVDMVREL